MKMFTAQRADYWIIQWSDNWDPSLRDLVAASPELVLGKTVAITSCDSGPYGLSPEEIEQGWQMNGTTAISPRVTSVSCLPTPGFDEWYVFDAEPHTCPVRNFVNRYAFSPASENSVETEAFWQQISAVRPLHALGAGTPNMFIVTRDRATFDRILAHGDIGLPAYAQPQ